MSTILVLLPPHPGPPRPPSGTPFGRAALGAARVGVELLVANEPGAVFGVHCDQWVERSASPSAIYDRYPSRSDPMGWAALRSEWGDLPWFNSPRVTLLCADKGACASWLGGESGGVPETVTDPRQFEETLERWGEGFLKPRFGALGRGVRRVSRGEALERVTMGGVRAHLEPTLLQRPISPPPGEPATALRVLVQRAEDEWIAPLPVARVPIAGEIANVARGAIDYPANEVIPTAPLAAAVELAIATTARMAQRDPNAPIEALELGVDLLFDEEWRPWVIEVNGRPAGRLAALATTLPERFSALRNEVVLRPILEAARLSGGAP